MDALRRLRGEPDPCVPLPAVYDLPEYRSPHQESQDINLGRYRIAVLMKGVNCVHGCQAWGQTAHIRIHARKHQHACTHTIMYLNAHARIQACECVHARTHTSKTTARPCVRTHADTHAGDCACTQALTLERTRARPRTYMQARTPESPHVHLCARRHARKHHDIPPRFPPLSV